MFEQACEKLDNCPFFQEYCQNKEYLLHSWIELFCLSKEETVRCKRLLYWQETGFEPPANLTPTGRLL